MSTWPAPLNKDSNLVPTSAEWDSTLGIWFLRVSGSQVEDAVANSGALGQFLLAIRRDTPASDAGDGDYHGLHTDSLGRLQVSSPGIIPGIPVGATMLNASSGNVAAATATATLGAASGVTTYITGFEITAGGATAAALVQATVTGLLGGTATYIYGAPAGVAVQATPLIVKFQVPLPASAANTAIAVALPSLGSGNTNAAVVAHGFRV